MEVTQIKVNLYSKTWEFKTRIDNIKNIDSLEFNEKIDGWQGSFTLDIACSFDTDLFSEGDLIQYFLYDDQNFKNWLLKYTWVVRSIERYLRLWEEGIKVSVEGLVSLLSDVFLAMYFEKPWSFYDAVEHFVKEANRKIPLTVPLPFIWNKLFKNWYKDKTFIEQIFWKEPISKEWDSRDTILQWNLYENLNKLFKNYAPKNKKSFFINASWEIVCIEEKEEIKRAFTLGKNITEISINKSWEILIDLANVPLDLQVWDLIILQNINKNLNLSWKRISELAFWISKVVVNAWVIPDYAKIWKK